MYELDLCVGLLMVIVYGLTSLRNKHLNLADVHFICQCMPVLTLCHALSDSVCQLPDVVGATTYNGYLTDIITSHGFDLLLCLITVVVIRAFKSFESLLLMLMAYIAQAFMMHSCDLVSFYVCLEAQNFCFLVLCGLQPDKRSNGFSVEASIKYLLLSAFSSGVLLFSFAALYLHTGMTSLFLKTATLPESLQLEAFLILLALLFKLGTAPVHLWVVDIYQGIKRPLLMYLSTAPKLSLFTFWASAWHLVWTDFTLSVFIVYTLILGSVGAYSQPAFRALLAYSTISEIGLMLLAVETAGFHSLFQHLSIYILAQLLLWNLSDKRLFAAIAVSLAGLPPLVGFFGKAWIFWHAVNIHMTSLLIIALACTALSTVYYLRMIRLFWNFQTGQTLQTLLYGSVSFRGVGLGSSLYQLQSSVSGKYTATFDKHVGVTSALFVALVFLPVFLIKPFVL
jgi:NADH:ubiquinone oxidoreductase subunit 2 (subunit N)